MAAIREHVSRKIQGNTKQKNIELGRSRIEWDERDIPMILSSLSNWVPDMWEPSQPICNIATEKIASNEMTKDALSIKEKGKLDMEHFV